MSNYMKLRTMAAAFILNGQNVLMIKKSSNNKLFPDMWAPVGGHMECDELNDPLKTCLREVFEETGIEEKDLNNIKLRFITYRQKEEEIRVQYIYFAETEKTQLSDTDEGELFWVNKSDLLSLDSSFVTKEILKYYFCKSNNNDHIMVGTVNAEKDMPIIQWSKLANYMGV